MEARTESIAIQSGAPANCLSLYPDYSKASTSEALLQIRSIQLLAFRLFCSLLPGSRISLYHSFAFFPIKPETFKAGWELLYGGCRASKRFHKGRDWVSPLKPRPHLGQRPSLHLVRSPLWEKALLSHEPGAPPGSIFLIRTRAPTKQGFLIRLWARKGQQGICSIRPEVSRATATGPAFTETQGEQLRKYLVLSDVAEGAPNSEKLTSRSGSITSCYSRPVPNTQRLGEPRAPPGPLPSPRPARTGYCGLPQAFHPSRACACNRYSSPICPW